MLFREQFAEHNQSPLSYRLPRLAFGLYGSRIIFLLRKSKKSPQLKVLGGSIMLELLFEGVVSPGYSTEYSYIYLAENPERVPPRREEYEVIDVVEIPLSRALEMLKSGQIRDMRAALALSLYHLKR